ncbi:MAG: uracil-DNA glycosylase [Bacillota bacterium]
MEERQQSLFELINDQPVPDQQDPGTELNRLEEICLECSGCDLRSTCRQVVFGVGNPDARLVLIGEGPGGEEDRLGEPFVGRAGQLLDRILEAGKLKREDIYITNIVKCRPPNNRLPVQKEIDACLPYLYKQIELINPKIILCLGSLAARTLLDKNISITRQRGQWHKKRGRLYMATFHPAALLRDPNKKKFVWEDIKQVINEYNHDNNGGAGK